MNIKPLILVCLFFTATCIAAEKNNTTPKVAQIIPFHIVYVWQLETITNTKTDILVRYYQKSSQNKLFSELHQNVNIEKGAFSISLGQGQAKNGWFSKYKTLHDVLIQNDIVEMSFKVGDVIQYPTVDLLPAGHSMASYMAIAVVQNNNQLNS